MRLCGCVLGSATDADDLLSTANIDGFLAELASPEPSAMTDMTLLPKPQQLVRVAVKAMQPFACRSQRDQAQKVHTD